MSKNSFGVTALLTTWLTIGAVLPIQANDTKSPEPVFKYDVDRAIHEHMKTNFAKEQYKKAYQLVQDRREFNAYVMSILSVDNINKFPSSFFDDLYDTINAKAYQNFEQTDLEIMKKYYERCRDNLKEMKWAKFPEKYEMCVKNINLCDDLIEEFGPLESRKPSIHTDYWVTPVVR